MKKHLYECDRCGKTFAPHHIERDCYGRFTLLHYQKSNEDVVCGPVNDMIDICPECNYGFNEWFTSAKTKGGN